MENTVAAEKTGTGSAGSAQQPRSPKSHNVHFRLFGKDYRLYDSLIGLGFIAPALVLGIIFVIAPIVVSLSYAFTDATMQTLDSVHWNNFYNFGRAFTDPKMWNALGNTCLFVVVAVPLQLAIALGLALLLNKEVKGNTFYRWAYFCPVMLSLAVTSFLWMNLFNEQEGLSWKACPSPVLNKGENHEKKNFDPLPPHFRARLLRLGACGMRRTQRSR